MTKVDKIQKRLAAIKERMDEIDTVTRPIRKQLQPFDAEAQNLYKESRKLDEELDEAAFVPSMEYFLSTKVDKFHYEQSNKKCSYTRMHDYIDKNYKHLKISGYNPKTEIYAIQLMIRTGADVDEVTKEIGPVIKLAVKAQQTDFHLFTDDLSESGIVSLRVVDGEYHVGKTRYGSYSVYEKFKTLKQAVEYCIKNKLTYSR